ncbi:hypothetical protein Anapl_06012 [Anas platyrhynchos]|uniref:Uncharacterized protein n=1 Tax=Anas platyrhynchos TaxID=8839 RepID=R0LVB8_ANAPL|nr:hypothetical protein Anapl_06012 [Anas platyrhynchos]
MAGYMPAGYTPQLHKVTTSNPPPNPDRQAGIQQLLKTSGSLVVLQQLQSSSAARRGHKHKTLVDSHLPLLEIRNKDITCLSVSERPRWTNKGKLVEKSNIPSQFISIHEQATEDKKFLGYGNQASVLELLGLTSQKRTTENKLPKSCVHRDLKLALPPSRLSREKQLTDAAAPTGTLYAFIRMAAAQRRIRKSKTEDCLQPLTNLSHIKLYQPAHLTPSPLVLWMQQDPQRPVAVPQVCNNGSSFVRLSQPHSCSTGYRES